LVEKGADFRLKNSLNNTASTISSQQGYSEIVKFLRVKSKNKKNSEISSILPSNKHQKKF
jgi:ankyrin repeat protein